MALEDFKSYLNSHKPRRVDFDLDYDIDYYGDYCYMHVTIEYYYSSTYDDDGSEWREISYDISRARDVVYEAVRYANSRYGEKIDLKDLRQSNTYDPD